MMKNQGANTTLDNNNISLEDQAVDPSHAQAPSYYAPPPAYPSHPRIFSVQNTWYGPVPAYQQQWNEYAQRQQPNHPYTQQQPRETYVQPAGAFQSQRISSFQNTRYGPVPAYQQQPMQQPISSFRNVPASYNNHQDAHPTHQPISSYQDVSGGYPQTSAWNQYAWQRQPNHSYTQQQPSQTYLQPAGAYQSHQPISSFQNTRYGPVPAYQQQPMQQPISSFWNVPASYNNHPTHLPISSIQDVSGGYPQTSTWNQYPKYPAEPSGAYNAQGTDYYSQLEVSCAPGTEKLISTSTSNVVSPLPAPRSGYSASTSQQQVATTTAPSSWRPESNVSELSVEQQLYRDYKQYLETSGLIKVDTPWGELQPLLDMNEESAFSGLKKDDRLKIIHEYIYDLEKKEEEKTKIEKDRRESKEHGNRDKFLELLKEDKKSGRLTDKTQWHDYCSKVHVHLSETYNDVAMNTCGPTPKDMFDHYIRDLNVIYQQDKARVKEVLKSNGVTVSSWELFKLALDQDSVSSLSDVDLMLMFKDLKEEMDKEYNKLKRHENVFIELLSNTNVQLLDGKIAGNYLRNAPNTGLSNLKLLLRPSIIM